MWFQSTHSLRSATQLPIPPSSTLRVSIHALLAECDFNPGGMRDLRGGFQSTHSLRSATIFWLYIVNVPCGFNPRTPCGVRRGGRRTFPGLLCFNPRTPCGVRQYATGLPASHCKFQSTHSLRSATVSAYRTRDKMPVSIHALLAECDPLPVPLKISSGGFNPRTPCGVRRKI